MSKGKLAITSVLFFLVLGFVYSQKPGMGMHQGMGGMMMDSTMRGCMMEHMAGHMMGTSLVPTGDGGVVLLLGNHLYKYDKNLDLKKTSELKIDTTGSGKWMGMLGCEKKD